VELEELQQVWNNLGQTDPLWAVLTDARYKDGGWDPDELFARGITEVDDLMQMARDRGLTFGTEAALDFGCGVGRLSQSLARYFDSVVGVDIAPSMIAEAESRNKQGERCRFVLNDRSDLSRFADSSFDFVLSLLVLQHMEPRYSRQYIKEFARVLRPGGLAIFQVPSGPEDSARSASRAIALNDNAYRAGLSCSTRRMTMAPGTKATVRVTARNVSAHSWPMRTGPFPLALGNHWLAADGTELRRDDGRAYLERDVASGKAEDLDILVTAPAQPGRYFLEFDLVHEGVTWFEQKGSSSLRVPVRVRVPWSERWQPRQPEANLAPVIEMYMVPTDEVASLVESQGARIASVDARQVPSFTDSTYFVTKGGSGTSPE
jgi:SAM-dependent methyltransferase